MAVIDASVGGTASNSYRTVVDADAYFLDHYSVAKNTLWVALTAGQKDAVLRRACQNLEQLRVLDSEYGSGSLPVALVERNSWEFTIHRLEVGQVLNFPRNIDLDAVTNIGFIPVDVGDAQCEQAVHLLAFDESPLITRLSGIAEQTIVAGPVTIAEVYTAGGTAGGTVLAPMAWELMRKYVRWNRRVQRA